MALTRPRFRQLDTSVVSTTDPITVLNQGASSANVDVGFLFNRANGLVPNVALYWSESSQSIVTAYTNGNGSINSNITVSSYANLKVGNVVVSGIFYSNGAPFSSFSTSDVATYLPTDPTIISLQANAGAQANQIAGANAAIVTANTALKSYVDAQDAAITSSITTAWQANAASQDASINAINANVGSFYVYANATYSTISNAGSLQSQINGANAAIVTANTALKSYVDTQDSAITTAWTANAATQAGQIAGANAAIVTANAALKSYVDTQDAAITTAWTANAATQDASIKDINANIGSFYTYSNATYSTIANAGSLQSQITGANSAIVTANTALKSYVDTQDAAITTAWTANAASQQGQITTLQGQVYTNANVNSYLYSSGAGNIVISNGAHNLALHGPGATTVGSSTAIPVITTDAYGRITALTSSPVSTTINLSGTSGTGSVSGGGTLTFAGSNGVTATASGSTITLNTPQNLQTTASPTFAGGTFNGTIVATTLNAVTVGNISANHVGTGTYLTSLNASNLSSGTVPLAQLSGITTSQLSATAGITNGQLANSSVTVTAGTGMSGGGAVSLGGTVTLTNAGVTGITGTANQVTASASTGSVTLSLPQNIHTGATPTFAGETLTGALTLAGMDQSAVVQHNGTGASWYGRVAVKNSTADVATFIGNYNSKSGIFAHNNALSAWGALYVNTLGTNGQGTAVYLPPNTYIQSASSDTGNQVLHAANYTSYSPSLTGSGASGTWSISITGSAGSASTATSATTATTATNLSGGSVSATTGSFSGATTRNSKALITNYTGTTAPTSPQQGDEWYKSDTGVMYKYIYDGTSYVWVNMSAALSNSSTAAVANTLALRDSSANLYAANFMGTASSAKYADLAENYIADADYEPGTVVVFGGEKEITVTNMSHDRRVAGVISTNPAYLMNSEAKGLPVALTGRVPCKVHGPVTKGDILVSSPIPGVAQVLDDYQYKHGCVLGKALESNPSNEVVTVEVVVGRF